MAFCVYDIFESEHLLKPKLLWKGLDWSMTKKVVDTAQRNIGLYVLRILSIALITARHFLGYSGMIDTIGFSSVNGIITHILNVFCGCAVNIFVLISGYFLVESTFRIHKAVRIWAETFFYSVAMFLISFILGLNKASASSVVFSFLPILTRHYWFAVAYLALYFLSPLLNKCIQAISYKEFKWLVFGGGFVLSAWTSFVFFSAGVLTGGNTGLLWFIYLYFVGAYIRKKEIKATSLTCVALIVIVAGLTLFQFLAEHFAVLQKFEFLKDDSVFELILSVAMFLVFLNMKVTSKAIRKTIVAMSTCSFGVYLIQESCMFRNYLWNELVRSDLLAARWYLFAVLVLIIIALFICAYIGEKIFGIVYVQGCQLLGTISHKREK